MADPAVRKSVNPWMAATCLLLSAVLAVNVFRACYQSITYDEAFTYHFYVAAPWKNLRATVANNHLVNSVACRATTTLFGVSELTLRMPSLAGGALYLVSVLLICRHAFGAGPFLPLATASIAFNPATLDYLSAARGYGLALGFLAAAMYQLLVYLDAPDGNFGRARERRHLILAAVCLALAVHSNLSFLIGASCLAVAFLVLAIHNGRTVLEPAAYTGLLRSLGKDFALPGALIAGVLAVSLVKMPLNGLNHGTGSVTESLQTLTDATMRHHHTTWPWDNESPAFQAVLTVLATWGVGAVVLAVALAWGAVLVRWVASHRGLETLRQDERFLLLCGGGLLSTCCGLLGFHFFLGRNYPFPRTGIYLFPVFFLPALAVLYAALHRGKGGLLLGIPGLAAALLLLVQFGVQLPTTHYHDWLYDSTSRQVFNTIVDHADRSSDTPVRVACQWMYLQSLNFYKAKHKNTRLEFVEMKSDKGRHDFYVFQREDSPHEDFEPTPLYHSAQSDVVVVAAADMKAPSFVARIKPGTVRY